MQVSNFFHFSLIRTIHVRQTYRKSRGITICTFEKFKFQKTVTIFSGFLEVFDSYIKVLAIICSTVIEYIMLLTNFHV